MFTIVMMVEIAIIVILLTYATKLSDFKNVRKTVQIFIVCLFPVLLLVLDLLEYGDSGLYDNVIDLVIANEVMLFSSERDDGPEIKFAAPVFLINLVAKILYYCGYSVFRMDRFIAIPMLNLLIFLTCTVMRAVMRFSEMKQVFGKRTFENNIQEYVRFVNIIVFLLIAIMCCCSSLMTGVMRDVIVLLSSVLYMAQFILSFIKYVSGNMFVLFGSLEKKAEEISRADVSFRAFGTGGEENYRMRTLFDRIVELMTSAKPFLDGDFDMDDLSKALFCNKLYLSRTINMLSGKNFRQFVNYYRICYAMDLMKKDPGMKLMEVAELSGFNSAATFNMAFKTNTGVTPSDWMEEYLVEKRHLFTRNFQHPSSCLEQGQ